MRMSGVCCLPWKLVYTVHNRFVAPVQTAIELIACRKRVYDEFGKVEEIR